MSQGSAPTFSLPACTSPPVPAPAGSIAQPPPSPATAQAEVVFYVGGDASCPILSSVMTISPQCSLPSSQINLLVQEFVTRLRPPLPVVTAANTADHAAATAAAVAASPFQPLRQHKPMPQPSTSMLQTQMSIVGIGMVGEAPLQTPNNLKRRNGQRGTDAKPRRKRRCGVCVSNNWCGCSANDRKNCACDYPCQGAQPKLPCEKYPVGEPDPV